MKNAVFEQDRCSRAIRRRNWSQHALQKGTNMEPKSDQKRSKKMIKKMIDFCSILVPSHPRPGTENRPKTDRNLLNIFPGYIQITLTGKNSKTPKGAFREPTAPSVWRPPVLASFVIITSELSATSRRLKALSFASVLFPMLDPG